MVAVRVLLALGLVVAGTAAAGAVTLQPCHLGGLREPVRCGTVRVPEDPSRPGGRQVALAVAVVPALQRDRRPDPLVLLAGGPGQAARDYAPLVRSVFAEVRRTRDVVLVDARGTGGSGALRCRGLDAAAVPLGSAAPALDVGACLRALGADVRHYTNEAIADDLATVLDALGYSRVNLWAGSFGTRTALVFCRRHPARVRSVVLDSPAPFGLRFPLHAAADAQRALDALVADCAGDAGCAKRFRGLAAQLRDLFAADAAAAPVVASFAHPVSGQRHTAAVTPAPIADAIRGALYLPRSTSLLPLAIEAAAGGDVAPVAALTTQLARGSVETMALGATLSVVCSEDVRFFGPAEATAAARGTFLGDRFARQWLEWCSRWPVGPAPDRRPRRLAMPALVISGARDPVTPPRWGEEMLRSFPRGRHLVVAGAAHNASLGGCLPRLMARFYDEPDPAALDVSCAAAGRRTGFVLAPTGVRSAAGGGR